MFDVFLDSLLDLLKLIPFLFIAFLIIELIEHKFSDKSKKIISNNHRFGPIFGSLLGAVPQCGFSALATNLYSTRIISIGTLISVYLSTSDEMLPILITKNVDIKIILSILLLKIIIGMLFGFIIDLIIRKTTNDFHICDEDECNCDDNIFKSAFIHTLKTSIYILIFTFILNIIFKYSSNILENAIIDNKFISPFISSLIGLIPNCGSSIMISELYINNVITFGTLIGGLLTNSGIALLILFRTNKNLKENISILFVLYFIGSLVGLLLNILM